MVKKAKEKIIDSLETARFFIHPFNTDHLTPFVAGEKTLAEAARELGISKNRMNYWVKKLLELRLIYVVRVEKLSRHNVAIYHAVAKKFIVPVSLLPLDSDEDIFQLASFDEKIKRSLADFKHAQMQDWQLHYEIVSGAAMLNILPPGKRKEKLKVVNSWGQLTLTETQAERFRREIEKTLERYQKTSQKNQGKSFLYRMIIVGEEPK
jgi:DNA-binding transcriptional regulator GbsR (MarR family)